MSLLQALDRPIAYHRCFVSIGGSVNAAVLLSQAFYWQNRTKDLDGWFFKTAEEWTEETGLTRKEQYTARKALREAGVLEEKLAGLPSKLYFRINLKVLEQLLAKCSGGTPSLSDLPTSVGNKGNLSGQKGESIYTETTSETTSETTDPPKPPLKKSQDGENKTLNAMNRILEAFNRKPGERLSYLEESTLAELAMTQNGNFVAQLEEVLQFKRNLPQQEQRFYPKLQSITSLLTNFHELLDKARNMGQQPDLLIGVPKGSGRF